MSSREIYRNPTWASLTPDVPRFTAAPPAVARIICKALGVRGDVLQLLNVSTEAKLYRVDGEDETSKFVKIISSVREGSVRRAEAIASWLAGRGIDVVCAEELPIQVEDGSWMFIYPFVDDERIEASVSDMSRLGQAVGALHAALAQHPDRDEWKQASRARLDGLADLRERISNETVKAGPYPDDLADITRQKGLDFSGKDCQSTPLHGDLNSGNILKRRADEKIVFLDFEDTFHSVLPPEFELGLLAERNILLRVDDDITASKLVTVLFDAYKAAGGSLGPKDLPRIPNILKSLSLRSLCVLADCERTGVEIIDSEWQKFFSLFKLAEARRKVFATLI